MGRGICAVLLLSKFNKAVEALSKDEYDDTCVLEVNCWNHFINVWLGVITKSLYNLLGNTLREELD